MNLTGNAAAAVGDVAPAGRSATSASRIGALLAKMKGSSVHDTPSGTIIDGLANVPEMAIGEYVGTGVAKDITLPFDPVFVIIIANTAPVGITFATATTNTQSAAQAINARPTGTVATVVTKPGAQSAVCGTAGQKKFTVGTDASVNANASKYAYVAFGL